MKNRLWLLTCLLLGVVALAACSREDPPPAPALPTPMGTAGLSVEPTEAAPQPTATVPTPAAPATAAVEPTTTLLPTPSATPASLLSPADFGQDRNPLTGELVSDPQILARRPLAVKISNAPPQWVRPQSGLNAADLVFEHITESTITRFTIIVYGQSPERVGPIRSARLIDLELPAMYDAALVFSGSSEGVRQRLLNADFRPRIVWPFEDAYFRSGENKPTEHTLYADPDQLWNRLADRGLDDRPDLSPYLTFVEIPPDGGQTAGTITMDYNWEVVEWRYDAERGRYLRWADGQPHLDGNTDEQVRAANVVVVFAAHADDTTICEQVINGQCTAYSTQILLQGSGDALVFRDGQQYPATWRRDGRYDMLTLYDASGAPQPLQIGNTWFEIMPTWFQDPITVSP
ncbi:MAG: DUF3048 domain-containing protein [Candidatus Promineifilaceae bacterium]|nr:DUF3048 domain-containing protein [Candidatus Promineifilaceae bacterium]